MKRALAIALVAAAAPARADIVPTFVVDGDYRVDPHPDVEGFDGFAFARVQLGMHGDISPTVSAAGLVDFAAGESPAVIDAYLSWRATPELEIAAGYLRSPLFPSARDEFVERLPVPELSVLARALWPGRSVGMSARWRPAAAPIDVQVRLANGANDLSGNDTNYPAADARVDYVFGRPRTDVAYGHIRGVSTRAESIGIRVGVGAHVDNVDDRPGASGFTAENYEFYRPAVVSGDRHVVEAHALLQYEGLQLLVEAGYTKEGRSANTTAAPGDRPTLAGVETYGVAGELAWMITGDHRLAGTWPRHDGPGLGAVEVALRGERVTFGKCATLTDECSTNVERLDATVAGASLHWWITPFAATSLSAFYYSWDAAPYDEAQRSTWLALARLTLSLR